MSLNLDLLESQHLIGKLKLIELLERMSPYKPASDHVDRRFSQALQNIPRIHHQAALTIFGTTIYLGQSILTDAWKYLWSLVFAGRNTIPELRETLVLELDRDQLRDEFYRANAIAGRLHDNLPWRSTNDMIDGLMQLDSGVANPQIVDTFRGVARRPWWVLLIDLSLSGASAESELKRLQKIRSLFLPRYPITIVALIQVLTEVAADVLDSSNLAYHAAIRIPRSSGLKFNEFDLVDNPELVGQMRELCHWFANEHVLPSDSRLSRLSKEEGAREMACYGFGGHGWSIVTHRNAPNNSLPLLWFKPPHGRYLPPFERIDSRLGDPWPERREWLRRAEADQTVRQRVMSVLDGEHSPT